MKIIVASLNLVLIIASNLHSQGIPYGQEFLVNTYTNTSQVEPSVAKLSDGGFVICWVSEGEDSTGQGIFAQVFSSPGQKYREEFKVTQYGTSPSAAGLADGSFVVCWERWKIENGVFNYEVYAQMFDSFGNKKGSEFQVNYYTKDKQWYPTITGLKDGGFVICWESMGQDDSETGIYGQVFEVSGAKRGAEFRVNKITEGYQAFPILTSLTTGDFVVCWESQPLVDIQSNIVAQVFNPSGNRIGSEIIVNTNTSHRHEHPSVSGLLDGKFVVCWQSVTVQDGSAVGIFGQMFEWPGIKSGVEFKVNRYSAFHQEYPVVTGLSDGGFVVGWETDQTHLLSYFDIWAQIYDSFGNRRGNDFRVNSDLLFEQRSPSLAGLNTGGFIVCWESYSQDGSAFGIFGKYLLNEPIIHILQEFLLIGPINDETSTTSRINFIWQQPSNIIECYPWELTFDLYIDADSNFPNPKIIKNIQDTTYTIDSLAAGKTYFWKVLAKNLAGDSLWSKQQDWGFFIKPGATLVESSENELPQNFELFQNYPNPFNSSTEIRYSLPSGKANYQVQLKIYDILGRLVKVLVDQEQVAGTYAISWDGTELGRDRVASGVYFYSIEAGDLKSIRKMLMLQ